MGRKIGVLTSGGDAPGMNAAIRAVVRCGIDKGFQMYGISRGYEGLIDGEIQEMDRRSVGDIMQRGGTILRTARSKRFMTKEGFKRALSILDAFGIDGLVVIGGDGSYHGAWELAKAGIQTMGIPGTIDNDLACTDYTIGFDTAVTTVLDAIGKLRDTSSAHERTVVVEVMGRHCGDIALYSGLAGGAEEVLVPELPFDLNELCRRVILSEHEGKLHSIIIKAEGVDIPSHELAHAIQERTGRETKLVVLSYLQRGGSPTMRDRLLATRCGARAVELFEESDDSLTVGTIDGRIEAFPFEEALSMKREFRKDLYDLINVLAK
ncbi:MAG: 6-phosphofructokinase [Eubacteriales bacterium]|nr:6-phosphofructokinase [Eubacteriales bacterium]